MPVRRIFVEKKPEFAVEAHGLLEDLTRNLGICGLQGVRILNRYDIEGMTDAEYALCKSIVFYEPPVDILYEGAFPYDPTDRFFGVEYLPGQYDQRADSAAQCVSLVTRQAQPNIRNAKILILKGHLTEEAFARIRAYCINPVESREASMDLPDSLDIRYPSPPDVARIEGFITMEPKELRAFAASMGFAMNEADLKFCQQYFQKEEMRDPTVTELRVIDTYWSDHCRHTTFMTELTEAVIEDGVYAAPIQDAYRRYQSERSALYGSAMRPETLMDMATLAMKALRRRGYLEDLDLSEEINACSIRVNADVDGRPEEWLVMFKNETHNHPTEIEPFGGAATCLGGAIRDPLSGRSYVYQAMRVTGSGDPRTPLDQTLPGKLPQRKITTGAAAGYSAYGNQIGLATGQVAEIYHPGYVAKRMEIGAVIGAAPRENVVRHAPVPGDVIVLLGGRTGRDGCGGATGSSKAHTETSLTTCGAEVQKGNPPTERKIQRLFRKGSVARTIKRCNDFGAGGVSVAIGELAPGLVIRLDVIPKKYEGLDGTELAISESQERMAVCLAPEDVEAFIQAADAENLEAVPVAWVTEKKRLRMIWRDQTIVDIARSFLDTHGAGQQARVRVTAPKESAAYFDRCRQAYAGMSLKEAWLQSLTDLNICSQRGLGERFDGSIGAASVLMPFGGKHQLSPAEGMAAKLPVLSGETTTATLMTFGFNPYLSEWSPFHGAIYGVVEALTKIAAMGGDTRRTRLTLQEYFERLGEDPIKWGKPFSALLGALHVQLALKIPAIGGKDSMSGSFQDLSVPPTLTAFAVCPADVRSILPAEFQGTDSEVIWLRMPRDKALLPDFDLLQQTFTRVHGLAQAGALRAARSLRAGGAAEALFKMAAGNGIGLSLTECCQDAALLVPEYGSLILEFSPQVDPAKALQGLIWERVGRTQAKPVLELPHDTIDLAEAIALWEAPLEGIFPTRTETAAREIPCCSFSGRSLRRPLLRTPAPRVLIPVFPGTNTEYDAAQAFERAGALPEVLVVRNQNPVQIEETIERMAEALRRSQILMLPGGFSGGDEPDGSGKFIAAVFRNPRLKEAVLELLHTRDGLILGICNGFQALIKLGLLPYGEIRDIEGEDPTLTFNTIGRHMSRMTTTRIASVLSPWLAQSQVGDLHTIPISHGEGRFAARPDVLAALAKGGQIATQYVDLHGMPAAHMPYNPNGSVHGVEGITSPDGRIFGKMGHSERFSAYTASNVPGNQDQKIFQSGAAYFS